MKEGSFCRQSKKQILPWRKLFTPLSKLFLPADKLAKAHLPLPGNQFQSLNKYKRGTLIHNNCLAKK